MGQLSLIGGPSAIDGSMDRRLGILAIKAKAYAPDLLSAVTWAAPDIGLIIPEWRPRTFARRPEGAGMDVTCTFEGHLTPDDANGVEYTLEGTTANDAIETHPDFITLLDVYGGNANEADHTKIWPRTLPGSDERNPMHGVTDYLVPGIIWTKKWTSAFLAGSLVRELGTIQQPPGNPPELSGNRSWLLIRVRAAFRGNIWQIEASWQLSGPYGWVPELYKYY